MLNQFSRTELIFGHEGMERLYNARADAVPEVDYNFFIFNNTESILEIL